MVEIAVRALSPGINDPCTANTCVDQIGACLCEMAGRALPSPYLAEDSGVRLINGDPLTWDRLVSGAFDQDPEVIGRRYDDVVAAVASAR